MKFKLRALLGKLGTLLSLFIFAPLSLLMMMVETREGERIYEKLFPVVAANLVWLALILFYSNFIFGAILLLIIGYWLMVSGWPFWKQGGLFCLLLSVAVAAYTVRLSLLYNWGPPKILVQALDSPLMDRDWAMTKALNQQFPVGTIEAALISALSKQGFERASTPSPRCRQPETSANVIRYGWCPVGTQEMTYDYEELDLVCGTRHLSINWSADATGKLTRLEATRYVACF